MIPPESVKSEKSELGVLVLPGARFAEQLAVVDLHMELLLGSVKAELDAGWIGPEHSPLGRERHVATVERLMRAPGRPDAVIVAGRHLLTIAAVATEFFRPVHEAIARGTAANDNAGGGQ